MEPTPKGSKLFKLVESLLKFISGMHYNLKIIGSCHGIFPRICEALVVYLCVCVCVCKFIFDSFLGYTGHVLLVLDLVMCCILGPDKRQEKPFNARRVSLLERLTCHVLSLKSCSLKRMLQQESHHVYNIVLVLY